MAIELTLDETALTGGAATPWAAVSCLSLFTFLLMGLEFLPVSLLTPIARDLSVSEGQAGMAITVSGAFAVATSLFGSAFLATIDRKTVVLLYTAVFVASSLAVALAPNFIVLLVGRALVGIAIGGFWSLSTAIPARLASSGDLAKAIALLQGGTAFALVLAAPLGSFLGGLIGWRDTFLVTVPIGVAALVWQLLVVPSMPATATVSAAKMLGLLRDRTFAIGMAATGLALIGQNALAAVTASLLVIWGFFSTPIPVAWNAWMADIVPGELEAAGGLQVALIQLAIAGSAFAGGMLFDAAAWWSTFLLAACLLAGSAGRRRPRRPRRPSRLNRPKPQTRRSSCLKE